MGDLHCIMIVVAIAISKSQVFNSCTSAISEYPKSAVCSMYIEAVQPHTLKRQTSNTHGYVQIPSRSQMAEVATTLECVIDAKSLSFCNVVVMRCARSDVCANGSWNPEAGKR